MDIDASGTLHSVQKTDSGHFCEGLGHQVSYPEVLCSNCPPISKHQPSTVSGDTISVKFPDSMKPEKYNCLPVDWPAAQETMGLPKLPEPKKIYSVAELAGRIERLEEQLDGLLDRIYRFNIKSTHKL